MGFPSGGSDAKESARSAGDLGLILDQSGRSPGERNGYHSNILAWRSPWTEAEGIIVIMMRLISGLNELVFTSHFESVTGIQ